MSNDYARNKIEALVYLFPLKKNVSLYKKLSNLQD